MVGAGNLAPRATAHVVVRFSPRQRQRPMNELIYGKTEAVELTPRISARRDMCLLQLINQQRLSGADRGSFLRGLKAQRGGRDSPGVPRAPFQHFR